MDNSLKTKNNNHINYCCPFCPKTPEILYFNEIDDSILFICPEHGKKKMDIHEYLELMPKVLDSSKNIEDKNCKIHNESFILYCKNCEMNICNKCSQDKSHLNHIKYKIEDIYPNNYEITLIANKMNIFIEEKNKLLNQLEKISDKIKFYDIIIKSIEKETSSYLRNINVKHLIYGQDIDLTKAVHDTNNISPTVINKLNLDKIINDKMLSLIKNKGELNLLNNEEGVILHIFNNSLMDIIKDNNIKLRIDINFLKSYNLENLKIINLKGNKIKSLKFLSNKKFNNLEFLGLNNNDIMSIDPLIQMEAPLIKELYLSKNKIDSINALEKIKMKDLQILWLSNNNIISIDSLKKSNIRKLERLGLNKNKISDISVFKYAKFPLLIELYLNDNNIDFDSNINKEIIDKLETKMEDFYY